MAVFTTENQTSAYAKDPSYYTGSGFVLGMLGYKKNGQKSLFGKIKDVALPVIGGIAGTLVGGPAGAAIGATLGQGLNAASNKVAAGIVGGAEDSTTNVDEDMSNTLARGNLGMSLGNLAGGVANGVQAGNGVGKILKDLAPTAQKDLPGIVSGMAGAIGANSTTTYPVRRNVKYFNAGGEVKPLTYRYAGMTFSIDQPKDYKIYDKDDKSEDLSIIDETTGMHYGRMRIGERVMDQHSNMAMKAIMCSSAPLEKKKEALGEHLYEELSTHRDDSGSHEFREGGEAGPGPNRKYDAKKVLDDFRAHNQRLIDSWSSIAAKPKANQLAEDQKYIDDAAAQVRMAKQAISALDSGQLTFDANSNKIVHKGTGVGYALPKSRTGYNYHGDGFNTQTGGLSLLPDSGGVGAMDFTKATSAVNTQKMTAQPAPASSAPAVQPSAGSSPNSQTGRSGTSSTTPARVPSMVQRGASAGKKPASTAPPVVTAQSRIQKMTHGQLVSTLGGIATPDPGVIGTPPPAPEAEKPVVKPNTDRIAGALGLDTPAAATNYDPKASAPTAKAPAAKGDAVGNLLDLGRVVTGAVMASKKTPTWTPPARFTNWQSQVEAKANQGYTPQEWNTVNGQIADSYAAGQTAMTNSLGSGATPGVVLAGLTRLNQQRGQQTQAAVMGDVSRRAQNFAQYGAMVNQDLQLDQQQFDQKLNQVVSGQQAGVQLAQAGLQNIEQRKLYTDNYGAGSLFQRLMGAQADEEQEATSLLRKMRENAMKAGTGSN
ncbi:hypothetical protein [Spirosoma fluviale]|uniref:Uncharacterized protein n=1 Tax=Spirosoma fluviale TaxID=1597977 RepID=A0A286FCJ3_9BACT|nr:hypothetical protein [Spirosoma fluviale]SOD80920.1 hypothetical protein SAMN06269250_1611 [Spirosoma fluviale]